MASWWDIAEGPGGLQTMALLLVPVLPVLLALALLLPGGRGPLIRLAPWAAIPALLLALLAPEPLQTELPWMLVGARLGLEETSRMFLAFTSLLWLLGGWYANSELADDPKRGSFFAFYLMAMSGNLGLLLAQDLPSFYLFFALMSFASYGLVVHRADGTAMRAGRIYMILMVLGEVALFAALIWMTHATGQIATAGLAGRLAAAGVPELILGLTLFGLGVKVGILPLHVTLPLVYSAAPSGACVVLAGPMLKAAVLGWLRLLPLGEVASPLWGTFCVAAGLTAAFYAVLVGLTQVQPKTVLAYSSISQMGLLTVPVGLALLVPAVWPMAWACLVLFAAHHALVKGTLFLGEAAGRQAAGGPWRRGAVAAGLLWLSLSLAGLPWTSGAVVKGILKETQAAAHQAAAGELLALAALLLPWTAVGTTLLMARFLWLAWPRAVADRRPATGGPGPSTSGTLWPWALAVTVVLLLPVLMVAYGFQQPVAASVSPDKLWDGLWPIGLGAVLAAAGWLAGPVWARLRLQIPPGDVLVVAEWLVHAGRSSGVKLAPALARAKPDPQRLLAGPARGLAYLGGTVHRTEGWLGRWRTIGLLFLMLATALVVVLSHVIEL